MYKLNLELLSIVEIIIHFIRATGNYFLIFNKNV